MASRLPAGLVVCTTLAVSAFAAIAPSPDLASGADRAAGFPLVADVPGGGWRVVPGLGRTGGVVTVWPSTLAIPPEVAPRLSYRFHATTGRAAAAHVRLLPTRPLTPGRGLRVALAVDGGPAVEGVLTEGCDSRSDGWKQWVSANAADLVIPLPDPVAPGWHQLHLFAVDAGVVGDKLVCDFGGLAPSCDGPAEIRLP